MRGWEARSKETGIGPVATARDQPEPQSPVGSCHSPHASVTDAPGLLIHVASGRRTSFHTTVSTSMGFLILYGLHRVTDRTIPVK